MRLRKKNKVSILAFILLFVLGPTVYFTLLKPRQTTASWYDDSFRYRRAVSITNSSGSTLTDFQVSFTLDTASLISAGKMQSDCDDIRITDASGNLIPHWIEENNPGCNNSSTKIWTKVPSIPTSGATIYVYYGNSSAGNGENGDNVFEFFDDFNDNNISDWTQKGVRNDATNNIIVSNGKIKGSVTGWNGMRKSFPQFTSNGWKLEVRYNMIQTSSYNHIQIHILKGDSTEDRDGYYFYELEAQDYLYVNRIDNNGQTNISLITKSISVSSGWHNFILQRDENGTIKFFQDTTEEGSAIDSVYNTFGLISVQLYNSNNEIDVIKVCKYVSGLSSSPSSTEEQSPAPVAYWKFDEGYGTTANDSAGSNNGTISGATWQTEDLCLAGKCLKFDGTDDYVGIGSTANEIKTVSFWVKPNTTTTYLLALNASTYISASSGAISATGFSSPTIYVNGAQSTTLTANQWQHIVVTTNTGITASAITLGKVSNNYLQGFLDEVKLYNFARTTNQIKADYNAGKAKASTNKGAAVVMGSPEGGTNLSEGLVGYWKMDEASWNGTSGEVIDSSGNGNHGTAINGATTGAGKFGNGGNFDGDNDYVNIDVSDMNLTGSQTISAWVKPNGPLESAPHQTVIATDPNYKYGAKLMSYKNYNRVVFWIGDGNNNYEPSASVNINDGNWHFITGIYDYNKGIVIIFIDGTFYYPTTQIGQLNINVGGSGRIGRDYWSTNYFNGSIDEIRIYNRALSPAEVRALYEWAPGPVAHFKLDDGSGTSPVDSSGFGRVGSIINGIWSVGKFGKGIKLDGSGDYIQINDF